MTFKSLELQITKEMEALADKHVKLLKIRVIELVNYLNKRGYKFDRLNMNMGSYWFTGESFELTETQDGSSSKDEASDFFKYIHNTNNNYYVLKIWDNKIAATVTELKEILDFIDASPWMNLEIDFKR